MLESQVNHAVVTLKFVLERCTKICFLLSLDCNFFKFHFKSIYRLTGSCKTVKSLYMPHLFPTLHGSMWFNHWLSFKIRTIPCTFASLWFLSCVQIHASAAIILMSNHSISTTTALALPFTLRLTLAMPAILSHWKLLTSVHNFHFII